MCSIEMSQTAPLSCDFLVYFGQLRNILVCINTVLWSHHINFYYLRYQEMEKETHTLRFASVISVQAGDPPGLPQ